MDQLAIIKYLAQGLPQEQVASIVGCTPGYISQLVSKADIQEQIEHHKKQYLVEKGQQEEDKEYNNLEKQVRKHLLEQMPYADYKDLIKLVEVLNRRKEKPAAPQVNAMQVNVTVLNVPAAAVPEFAVNSNNEVIGVGETSLAPMSAKGVKDLFAEHKAKQEQEAKDKEKAKQDIEDAHIIVDLDRQVAKEAI